MPHAKSLGDFDVITGPAAPARTIAPAGRPRPSPPGARPADLPEPPPSPDRDAAESR